MIFTYKFISEQESGHKYENIRQKHVQKVVQQIEACRSSRSIDSSGLISRIWNYLAQVFSDPEKEGKSARSPEGFTNFNSLHHFLDVLLSDVFTFLSTFLLCIFLISLLLSTKEEKFC